MARNKDFELEAEEEQAATQDLPAQQDPDPGNIPIPDGVDEAIFTQGTQEAAQDMRNQVSAKRVPPFEADSHQADSWQQGYDAVWVDVP